MRKMDNNTIYKLYRDTKIKPTHDLYIKPLAGLASSSLALALATTLASDNNLALCASVGMVTFFGLSTIKKIKLYNKIKEAYEPSYSKISKFTEEAQKVLGTEYNLNPSNIAFMPRMGFEIGVDSFYMSDIIFRDVSKITEEIVDGEYSCIFYTDETKQSAIDITDIAKKVLERK